MYVCMYVCMCVCVCNICMYVCMCVCNLCMYVCMYVFYFVMVETFTKVKKWLYNEGQGTFLPILDWWKGRRECYRFTGKGSQNPRYANSHATPPPGALTTHATPTPTLHLITGRWQPTLRQLPRYT